MTQTVFRFLWLIPALPLAGAAVNLFFGKRLGKLSGVLASATMGVAFVLSAVLVKELVSLPAEGRLVVRHLFDWIKVGNFTVAADLRLDQVSAIMILVVTGVGSLIHVYAIGYMDGDPRVGRFFAYLNLFVFFMLMLVLGENLLLLYLGWEGVGLCSYLLIGFWFDRPEAALAAKKAFITTRIGDTLMLVGLALIVAKFGTLDFTAIFNSTAAGAITKGAATAIALLLFAGAIGKSAQVPLHVWLPDAMAGPTPVSALIHAATMVTAGVYLVVRMHPIFELSGVAMTVVLVVGLVTAIFAGTCAFGQDDIKRVLAYSTVSQLGFMFMAVGMRAYAAALFMLVAHAFYKALMFLGAGSVMHGTHDATDMKTFGGLRKTMPITAFTFLIGAAAQAGVPPLAGFFAKDAILEIANHTGRIAVYVLGTFAALLSAAYIGRLVFLTFFGEPRSQEAEHAHESPPVMWVPLAVLAVGAAFAGWLNFTPEGRLAGFLEPVAGRVPTGPGLTVPVMDAIAVAVTLGALIATWYVFASGKIDWLAMRERLQPIPRMLQNGWYVDKAYQTVFVEPGRTFAGITAFVVDLKIIDGLVNAIGAGVKRLASAGRHLQTGYVRNYALGLGVGLVALLFWAGVRG
ncbi:MAG: NADH-quinone oxidoreductase subunit [Actinomycetota bacterium]|jgi:NADH-quinone oxidoreductase subunit L|nr:NADH-quinone oxidoreductase subunit [Actinomycetota bacterium]